MKAIVCTEYGPPQLLRFTELPQPVPAADEVLVRVHAASVNPMDWHILRGEPFPVRFFAGLFKPKHPIPGSDFAGQIESVGSAITRFKPGDLVFGARGFAGGAFAEYLCATETQIAPKPPNVSFEQAAAVPVAAVTALIGLRDKGRIRPGLKVLVDGASGGVGTFAIQLARYFDTEVTAVCSTRNLEIARSLGAARVIDYSRQDFTRNGERYDLILAANAFHSIFDYRRALAPDGICVTAGGKPSLAGTLQDLFLGPLLTATRGKKTTSFLARLDNSDLVLLGELLASGKLVPVIDRRYPLSAAADAIAYLEEGHAQGKVILNVSG